MDRAATPPLRIAVIGGGPAGSFFALYGLHFARLAGRDVAITIYDGKGVHQSDRPTGTIGAGIIPLGVVDYLAELELAIPPALILGRVNGYMLHTAAGSVAATRPAGDPGVISVYRGGGPGCGHEPGRQSFDDFLVEQAVARGADLQRAPVQAVRRGPPHAVVTAGASAEFDLVVLASGVNGCPLDLDRFPYRPPPLGVMGRMELDLGQETVERRLGGMVHLFLPPAAIAAYGVLIPNGPFVTVSLLDPRVQMGSLQQFLALSEVRSVLGEPARPARGWLPRITVGPARQIVADGFVAIGDASSARLYKNGIGSALATARRAAWTAINHGWWERDFARHYLPLCRAIDRDNRLGRLLFLQVPVLKRGGIATLAHQRLATDGQRHRAASELYTRILWGMFTGTASYRQLLGMAITPGLVSQWALEVGRAAWRATTRA